MWVVVLTVKFSGPPLAHLIRLAEILLVLGGVAQGDVVGVDVPADRTGGATDPVELIACKPYTGFNSCSVRKGLNNLHTFIYC